MGFCGAYLSRFGEVASTCRSVKALEGRHGATYRPVHGTWLASRLTCTRFAFSLRHLAVNASSLGAAGLVPAAGLGATPRVGQPPTGRRCST